MMQAKREQRVLKPSVPALSAVVGDLNGNEWPDVDIFGFDDITIVGSGS